MGDTGNMAGFLHRNVNVNSIGEELGPRWKQRGYGNGLRSSRNCDASPFDSELSPVFSEVTKP